MREGHPGLAGGEIQALEEGKVDHFGCYQPAKVSEHRVWARG